MKLQTPIYFDLQDTKAEFRYRVASPRYQHRTRSMAGDGSIVVIWGPLENATHGAIITGAK